MMLGEKMDIFEACKAYELYFRYSFVYLSPVYV